jgi:hypothetical protein
MPLAPPGLQANTMERRCGEHDTVVSGGLCTVSNYLPALCRSYPQYEGASPSVINPWDGFTRPAKSVRSMAGTVYRCDDYRGSELMKEYSRSSFAQATLKRK